MRSKLAILSLMLITTGCGLLGSKDAPSAASNIGTSGCLNNTSDLVSRYVSGAVSDSEWKGAFDCVSQSMDFFTTYVRGSTGNSYSPNDMYNLVSKFLITNRPVHPALMTSALSLKAALIGGNSSELTKGEIELVKTTLGRLRDITGALIPYLKYRTAANPNLDDLQDMVAAFKNAGDQLADVVSTLPTNMLSDQAVESLMTELQTSLDLPVIKDLAQTVFLVKWVLFNSRRDAVEVTDWPIVFKTAMGISGILIAYKASVGEDPTDPRADVLDRLQNDYRFREFLLALAEDARPYFNEALARHHGAIPFPLFDHLIDVLPDSMMDNVPKTTLKQFLRPLLQKFLLSTTKMGLDQGVIDTTFGLLEETVKDLGLLDRLYEKTGMDRYSVTPAQFNQALTQYAGSLSGNDQVRFAIIKQKLLTYQPMLYRDTMRIRFQANIGYSKQQHTVVLAVDRIVRHLAKSYGSGPDYFTDDDLTAFFHEYQDILFALKAVDPTVSDFGPKRKSEMDLFTAASDGNGQASMPEIINWAMLLLSANTMTNDMRAVITPKCDVGLGIDLMGWTRLPADCFRREFNDKLGSWLEQFPRLQKYWLTQSAADQAHAMVWLEHGGRRNGYTNVEFDKFDINAMATLLHYTESLFTRFDADQSEYLTKSEVKTAYPTFKILLAKKANMSASNDYVLKGIFTYIVKYRSMPQTNGITNLAKLGWWLGIYALPVTNYGSDRLGVFNIVCQLATPESSTQQAATPTICK